MTAAPARSLDQRQADTRRRLDDDVDLWVATADPDSAVPYLVPLSFRWDGTTLLVATPTDSPTGRNLRLSRQARVALGPTRDVVIIDVDVEAVAAAELAPEVGDAFAARTGFEPRELSTPYHYFRLTPRRIQAWREANELAGRDLMRDGQWR